MWPWGHAALGYLLYTVFVWIRTRESPTGVGVLALLVGTQTPDLIDKPLAWYFHILDYGRSLAHSVFTGGAILLIVVMCLRWRGYRGAATAFVIGYLSHLVGDSYTFVLADKWANLAFLVWPLLPIPDTDSELEGIIAHFRTLDASAVYSEGVLLAGAMFFLWVHQGTPGLWTTIEWIRRVAGEKKTDEPL